MQDEVSSERRGPNVSDLGQVVITTTEVMVQYICRSPLPYQFTTV